MVVQNWKQAKGENFFTLKDSCAAYACFWKFRAFRLFLLFIVVS